jgi:hypothetical protein
MERKSKLQFINKKTEQIVGTLKMHSCSFGKNINSMESEMKHWSNYRNANLS